MAISKMGKPTMKPGMSTAKDGMKKPTPMANTMMAGAPTGMKKGGKVSAMGAVKTAAPSRGLHFTHGSGLNNLLSSHGLASFFEKCLFTMIGFRLVDALLGCATRAEFHALACFAKVLGHILRHADFFSKGFAVRGSIH